MHSCRFIVSNTTLSRLLFTKTPEEFEFVQTIEPSLDIVVRSLKSSMPGLEIPDREDVVGTLRTVQIGEKDFDCDAIIIWSICLSSYVLQQSTNLHEKRAWATDLKNIVFESLRSTDIINVSVATSALLDIQRYASSNSICTDNAMSKFYNEAVLLIANRWSQLVSKRIISQESASQYQLQLGVSSQFRDRDLLIEEDAWRRELNKQLDCADEPW